MKEPSVGINIKVDYRDSKFVLYKMGDEIWKGEEFDDLNKKLSRTTRGHTAPIMPISYYSLDVTDDAKLHLEESQVESLESRIKMANLSSRTQMDERRRRDDRLGRKY